MRRFSEVWQGIGTMGARTRQAFSEQSLSLAARGRNVVRDEQGAEAIEWLGLVAVIVAVLAAAMTFSDQLGQAIFSKILEFINSIKVGG